MSKCIKSGKFYYTVVQELRDYYVAYPHGGGFEQVVYKEDAEIVPSVPSNVIDCYAQLEGSEKLYPCKANPFYRWNGWASPSFAEETLLEILKDNDVSVTDRCDDKMLARYNAGGYDPFEIYKGSDGMWFFDCWCWSIYDEHGCYIDQSGSSVD